MPEKENGNGARPGPRPFWSGTLTFGLVNVPVRLFSAIRSGRGSLRMVDEKGHPLSQQYVCPREGRPVSRDEIVRGYDVSPSGSDESEFVVVTEEELEGLQPEKTREIDLRRFVPVDDLDPVFFQRAYVLTPAEGSVKAYRLLARVMEETGRAGVATFVMRSKEYLVAILAEGGILRAETMRFHDEIRTPEDVGLDAPDGAPDDRVDALVRDIEKLERDDIDRDELEDREGEELMALVEEKRKRGEDVVELPEEEGDDGERGESRDGVIDLMEVLRRSLTEGERTEGERTAAERTEGENDGEGKGAGRLEDRTKEELYERAKELDIAGRSSMTKKELAEAIRRAG